MRIERWIILILGEHKDIQRLKCQACGGTFSGRKGTPLYDVKTGAEEVEVATIDIAP